MKIITTVLLSILCCCLLVSRASAKEIILTNGDRISGNIVMDSGKEIVVQSEILGTLTISKDHLKDSSGSVFPKEEMQAEPPQNLWNNEISLGYSQTGGNTENQAGEAALKMHRKTKDNEFNFEASGIYGSSDQKMDTQYYRGLIRYAYSFSDSLKWYHFTKLEGSRDRFANINYRLTPSTGIGYWFSDQPPLKAMAEIGLGYEHTNYRDETENSHEAILVPRAFFEKTLLKNLVFSQQITLYPSLSDFGEYRFYSESSLTNNFSDRTALRLSFIDEYNSHPSAETKKNDFRIISSVVYNF